MKHDISFCGESCEIGKAAKNKYLNDSESVFDAVYDFWYFVDECKATCKYNEEVKNDEDN